MTFSLTKVLSSNRTNSNGQLNTGYVDPTDIAYEDDHPVVHEHQSPMYLLDMNKEELITYAQDMFGLKLHRKMSAGNMVKEIYDSVHVEDYIPPNERVRKVATNPNGARSVGRPKGSTNKVKKEPLIENL